MDDEKKNILSDSEPNSEKNGGNTASKRKNDGVPFYKKWWFWVIIAVVVLALIGGIAGGTSSDTDKNDLSSGQTDTGLDGGTVPDNDSSDSGSGTVTENKIGSSVSNKADVTFKVEKVIDSKTAGDSYSAYKTDANFVIVTIKITNNGDSEYEANPYNFNLKRGSVEYAHHLSTYAYDNGMSSLNGINPGITKTFTIVFETPTSSATDEYRIVCGSGGFLGLDAVTILLK